MFNKKIDTKADINEFIAARWSGRAYDPDKILTHEQIISLLEAARWAPSCFGDQPWRFIVFNKVENKVAWDKAIECLSEGNQSWASNAPVLILSSADSIMTKTGQPNGWAQYDTGAATENLCLQATTMGLMTHQMGGFDVEKAQQLFKIPTQFMPMAMVSIGYQLSEAAIPEDLKTREYSPRVRNPLNDNFFNGSWGEPVD